MATGKLDIGSGGLHQALRTFQADGTEIHILGHPIANARRDDQEIVEQFERAESIETFARSLDGNFLVVINRPRQRLLWIVSDRFSGYPFYWAEQHGRLLGSLSLIDLVQRLGSPSLDPTAAIQFLHFRRLFGEKTYDRRCRYFASAGILECSSGLSSFRKYWEPDYDSPIDNLHEGADAIVEALRYTMRIHMEGMEQGRRYGLFMSGGLDSRALLAAAPAAPVCVTTCPAFNNEAQVAKEVAECAGAPFFFIQRPKNPYDGFLPDAIWYGGGQHVLTEAHFIGYDRFARNQADCFFIGLGLDVFLGGLYQPKIPARWFGRDALHSHLKPLHGDITSSFINGVKYRLKSEDAWSTVDRSKISSAEVSLQSDIGEIAERGRARGAAGYDLWEYFHLHNFSRHYSFLMIQSVRHWAECRAPGFCNDLLDLAIRLRPELKVNSAAYLAALNRMAPDLMKIRNANTNIAAGMPFARQSLVRAGRIAANRVVNAGFRVSPAASERSWPRPAEVLRESSELTAAVHALLRPELLESFGLFDLDIVRHYAQDHLDGRVDRSALLLTLITLHEFCRQVHQ